MIKLKKILILLLSLIIIAVFNITALAENSLEETPSTPSETTPSESAPSESTPSESSSSESSDVSSEVISSSESEPSSSDISSSDTSSSDTSSQVAEITLQVMELPKKIVYELGETLDVTGLKVNIISNSGIVISRDGADLTIPNIVFNTEGKQQIEVKYQDAVTSFEVAVNPKHTHNYGAWEIEKEATCEAEGSKTRECECKTKENVVINKLGHDWNEGKITKKATTTAEGEIKYTCTRCSKEKTEKIPMLGEETATSTNKTGINFKLTLEWWMIFLPVGLIIAGYITAISVIFKKKS